MSQKFRYAGPVQGKDGICKIKFTNNLSTRIYKFGDMSNYVRFDFVDCEQSMDKLDCLQFLQKHEKFQNDNDQILISDMLIKYENKSKNKEIKVVLKTGKASSFQEDNKVLA